jgi:hypothetical protein
MIRDDIIGMLEIALQKGKNLQQTIQSLYNSGYPKAEVDEAVQILKNPAVQQPVIVMPVQKPVVVQQPKQPVAAGQTKQVVSAYPYPVQQQFYQPQQQSQPQPVFQQAQPTQFYQPNLYPAQILQSPQIISNYEQPKKFSMGKTITIIMVVMLMILLGILALVIMFKPELENFINNL